MYVLEDSILYNSNDNKRQQVTTKNTLIVELYEINQLYKRVEIIFETQL